MTSPWDTTSSQTPGGSARGPLNRPEINQGLAQFFALKGDVKPMLGPIIVPTIQIAQLNDTPYHLRFGRPVMAANVGNAIALKVGLVYAQPDANHILQVKRLLVNNLDAVARTFAFLVLSAADIAAFDVVDTAVNMIDVGNAEAKTKAAAVIGSGNKTAAFNALGRLDVPAMSTFIMDLPDPGIFIFGNDPNGIGAVAVEHLTVNLAVSAAFYGNVWPLPS